MPHSLARAIQSSSLHLVRRLLDTALNSDGSPLDASQPDPVTRKTSLIVAAEAADLDMCRMLIEEYNVEADTVSRVGLSCSLASNPLNLPCSLADCHPSLTLRTPKATLSFIWQQQAGPLTSSPSTIPTIREYPLRLSIAKARTCVFYSDIPMSSDVLDWANSAGMTALHVASQKGHEATVSVSASFMSSVRISMSI